MNKFAICHVEYGSEDSVCGRRLAKFGQIYRVVGTEPRAGDAEATVLLCGIHMPEHTCIADASSLTQVSETEFEEAVKNPLKFVVK